MQTSTIAQSLTVVALIALAAAGCSQPAGEQGADGPRVFFVHPVDGATVQSPVQLEFGAEDFRIAAVPKDAVTDTRPDLGHYHVALDTDCLPAGTEIPKADPWIHFGDGRNTIEMQLPTGEHRLTLQIGDDLHRTIGGLCTTISVTVTE